MNINSCSTVVSIKGTKIRRKNETDGCTAIVMRDKRKKIKKRNFLQKKLNLFVKNTIL